MKLNMHKETDAKQLLEDQMLQEHGMYIVLIICGVDELP